MKTINSIISKGIQTIIIITVTGTMCFAGENDKIYTISDNGEYQYQYAYFDQPNKTGTKPVTVRTFYLETYRKGLIPEHISYEEFLKMSLEEQQALLNDDHRFTIYTVDQTDPIDNELEASESMLIETNAYEEPSDEVAVNKDSELNYDRNLPWIVQVTIDPYDGYKLPAQVKKNQAKDILENKTESGDTGNVKTAEIILKNVNACPATSTSTCSFLP